MHQLGGSGKKMEISLKTIGTPHIMHTYELNGLQVCDIDMNLPTVYTKDKMPVAKTHIPTNENLVKWSHLNNIVLPDISGTIGLMIGNNVPDTSTPYDIVTGPAGSPHATRSRLDDCLVSTESDDKAISLVDGVRSLCNRGGFNLTKWVSTSSTEVKSIPDKNRAKDTKQLNFENKSYVERALGVSWYIDRDVFGFQINTNDHPHTKRGILSVVSSVYDPNARYHTFVANRLALIHEATDNAQWHYVNTKQNPADFASRGMTISKFQQNPQWISGPDYLWLPEDEWLQVSMDLKIPDNDTEVKRVVNVSIVNNVCHVFETLISGCSDFDKLKRIVAWLKAVSYFKHIIRNNDLVSENDVHVISSKDDESKQLTILSSKRASTGNPPAASNFGGVWERLIRSVRKVLYSILQEQKLRLDEENLQPLFCEVEAILNGRPITEVPNSVNDLKVLTPIDILLHRSGECAPQGILLNLTIMFVEGGVRYNIYQTCSGIDGLKNTYLYYNRELNETKRKEILKSVILFLLLKTLREIHGHLDEFWKSLRTNLEQCESRR
ncbi:unnamed protein product [Mytilus coruscus]|uniref:Uncharacterized protein n=1 Tax=Mytilus coruscus TaxID=42192 RepID=A0A6J8ECM9_MYTCO|nr:unnamed protein product [Mytilus coruscus]